MNKKEIYKYIITIVSITIIFSSAITLLPEIQTSYKDIVLNWKDISKIIDKFLEILGVWFIPLILYYFGNQENKRKEERNRQHEENEQENTRIHKLQNYYKDSIISIMQELNTINKEYKDRKTYILLKLATHKNNKDYKQMLSIANEEIARADWNSLIGIISRLYQNLQYLFPYVKSSPDIYIKVVNYIKVLQIICITPINQFLDRMNNDKLYYVIYIIQGRIQLLLLPIESWCVYCIGIPSEEQAVLQYIDTIWNEILIELKKHDINI